MGTNLYTLSDGIVKEMSILNYETEKELQEIIANNSKLIVRSSDPDNAKLYLISKEMKSFNPDYDSESFSLDHLFVDQEGMPVLVEVKRYTDTRIRREVTAQMLDYAARASSWDVTELKNLFMESNKDLDPEELERFSDDFWNTVANNLRAERMKLVFAADKIPDTLKILIEFLDRAMPNIEVYGIEIHQFQSEDSTLLTTECIENALTTEVKTSREKIMWGSDNSHKFLEENGFSDFIPVWEACIDKAMDPRIDLKYGEGHVHPTIGLKYNDLRILNIGVMGKGYAQGWSYVQVSARTLAKKLNCEVEEILSLAEGLTSWEQTDSSIELINPTKSQISEINEMVERLIDFINKKTEPEQSNSNHILEVEDNTNF